MDFTFLQKKRPSFLKRGALAAIFIAGPLLFLQTPPARSGPSPSVANDEQKNIQSYLDAAFEAYVGEDYEKAMSYFTKVLQIDPYDAVAKKGIKLCKKKLQGSVLNRLKEEENKIKIAKKLIRDERWLDAIDNLREISARSPQHTEAVNLLSEVEMLLRKKISTAIIGSGDYLIHQGFLFYLNRRYEDALRVWREAEKISWENVKVAVYIERIEQQYKETLSQKVDNERDKAKAAFDAGNYEEAAGIWKKILEFDPANEEARSGLAQCEEMASKKTQQNLIGEYYDRGLKFFQEEKYPESLREWKNILSINPQNEVALEYVKRIEKKGVTVAAEPETPVAQPVRSSATASVSQETAASAPMTAQEAVPMTPPAAVPLRDAMKPPVPPAPAKPAAPTVSYEKGIELLNSGKYQDAVQFFDQLFQANPDDPEAKKWLAKSIQEQNENSDIHYRQGVLAYSSGNLEEAIGEWQKALEIYPNHPASKRALAKIGIQRRN